ncbi:MAG: TonB-dependent receptor plug domain-containing protein [Flavobacteriales bacterium]|nr:TonB-dependent receptor plug domain-containing protein [Flavobacteriales bacterium]
MAGGLICSHTCLFGQSNSADDRLLRADGTELIEQALDADAPTVRTSLADMGETDVREAPSNVFVITARQIQASGARDLLDALRLIPGLSFGRDVDDVIGVGIHGNWAEEGKCLFLLNGLQLNENDFGTYSIGQRIPLDNVERIEVIAGPGSLIHGGYAALGVINIITRTAQQATGCQASGSGSVSNGSMVRNALNVSGSTILNTDQEVNYMASLTRGNRSNALTTLPDGREISFGDSTAGQTAAFQFSYRWRGLKAHLYYLDEGYEVSDGGYQTRMRDMIMALEQRKELNKRVQLGWKLVHDDQIPWYYVNTSEPERIASNTSNVRTTANGHLRIKATPWLSVRIGGQAYRQRSSFYSRHGAEFTMNDSRDIAMLGAAAFLELETKGKLGNLTGGYRFEHNSLSGSYFAPRASFAKVVGRFHGKLLASRAFKIPTVMNLNYGPLDGTITTEYTNSAEAEFGLRLGKSIQFTTNIYHTAIQNPIVYVFDAATFDNYINRPSSGTEGLDARVQMEREHTSVYLGLGMYRTLSTSDLPEAELPQPYERAYQGLPRQRASAVVAQDLGERFIVRARATWNSVKHSFEVTDSTSEELSLVEWNSELVLDGGITFRQSSTGKWSLDLNAYNILNTQRRVLSPYANGSIPLTLNGREFGLRFTYRFAQQ